MKEVGKAWQSLDSEQKANYEELAQQDKIRYNKELIEYEKELNIINAKKDEEISEISRNLIKETSNLSSEVNKNPIETSEKKNKEKNSKTNILKNKK